MIEVDRIIDDVYYKGYCIYNNILRVNINKNSKENWFNLEFCYIDNDNILKLKYLNLINAENPKEILLEIDGNPFKYLKNLLIKTLRGKYKQKLGNKAKLNKNFIQAKCESDMKKIASEYGESPILNNIELIKNYMSTIISISSYTNNSSDIVMINDFIFIFSNCFTENNIPRVLLVEENNARLIEYSKIMDYAS
jgi:hypothetical protein